MNIHYTTFSEAGNRRNNEDYIRIADIPSQDRTAFFLCDGMGGHAMGDLASRTVGDSLAEYWTNHPDTPDTESKVKDACMTASESIDRASDAVGHLQMGTTMVMASIEGNNATIAHIGDSRCYVLRRGCQTYEVGNSFLAEKNVLFQTLDHTAIHLGHETVARCFFSYRQDVAEPDIISIGITSGDVIFLCSDGVDKYVRPDIMVQRLLDDKSPDEIADVIKFLCEKNSDDNYSGIIIQVK